MTTFKNPLISVLVAAYNVEQFIDATLQSFDNQKSGLDQIEIIIVNDGSTDSTLRLAESWASGKPNVKVVDKSNGGAASARKVAMENATGKWITSVDPDDILDDKYFDEIIKFLELDGAHNAHMLVTRILTLNDTNGRLSNNHPLEYRFRHGTRIVSLIDEPDIIQLGATALILREVLENNSLTYDTRIEPTFEDAHLLGRYLSKFEEPLVGLIPRAKYYYRKRADASSLVQSSWSKHERFSTVLRFGYLDLLKQVHWTYGYVPTWAQNMVLYDIFWYFKEDAGQYSRAAWIDDELRDEFLELLREIFGYISVATINRFWINPIWWTLRQVVITYFKCDPNELRIVQWSSSDAKQETNFSILQHPDYETDINIWCDGELIEPTSENFVVHKFFDVPMLRERAIVVPRGHSKYTFIADEVRYYATKAKTKVPATNINHSRIALNWKDNRKSQSRIQNKRVRKLLSLKRTIYLRMLSTNQSFIRVIFQGGNSLIRSRIEKFRRAKASKKSEALLEMAKSEHALNKYRDVWILMDRPDKADDNAEHLYRFLQQNNPEINIIFVLQKASSDWDRLSREGFRLLEPGSDELVLAVLNAKFRISSDAVAACMYPVPRHLVNKGTSKFIFLQHGVLMNDLSRWLNPKDIAAIAVSSVDEEKDLVGEDSPYVYKRSQVLPVGLARFDHLRNLSNQTDPVKKNRIVVMPTWRQHLRDTATRIESTEERQKYLESTQFFTEWMKVLHSSRLRHLCEQQGVRITFIPHPALREIIRSVSFPKHVEVADLSKSSMQLILSEAALFVTDYSSVAFDASFIGCPTIYYQFDRDEVFSGTHNFRVGYFDYKTHGLGPVVENSDDTIDTIYAYVNNTYDDSKYKERRMNTFINNDSNNCSRIVKAIRNV